MNRRIKFLSLLLVLSLTAPAFAADSPPATEAAARQQAEQKLKAMGLEMPDQPPPGFDSWSAWLVFMREEFEPRCTPEMDLMVCGQQMVKDPLWSPWVKTRLDQLLAKDLKGQVAVFDADGTLWRYDAEYGFLHWLFTEGQLDPVHARDGSPMADYLTTRLNSHGQGAAFAAFYLSGLQESRLKVLAQAFFQLKVRAYVYTSQQNLIRKLQSAGAEVWIISSLNQWLAEAGARHLGVPPEHVIGTRLEVVDGRLTQKILEPVPSRQGKVEAIRKFIGKQPFLAIGDAWDDKEMLSYASQFRLVIHSHPDPAYAYLFAEASYPVELEQDKLQGYAEAQHWLVQLW